MLDSIKAAVYNMHWQMRDITKIIFKDHREVSKLLKVLTETGGYYKTTEFKYELVLLSDFIYGKQDMGNHFKERKK